MWCLSRAVQCVKASDLVRTAGFKQHVFKWGVGNKFRSINANRFTPVHHARLKEVTVREDYFDSPDVAIQFDALNEQWEVSWFEHHKLNAKPFPVKKFGIEQSKNEALSFLQELKASGRFSSEAPNPTSNQDNVFWDNRMQAWFACVDGNVKAFSATKHGSRKAQRLAESVASNSKSVALRKELLDGLAQLKAHSTR